MRVVLQRVRRSTVRVDNETVGAVDGGFLALVGVAKDDGEEDADWIAKKILGLRVFADDAGKMNRSITETGGGVLLVSQFTLFADAAKGRRPSFEKAARPELAVPLLDRVARAITAAGVPLATGRFGAMMDVELLNDGPVTILLDSEDARRKADEGAAGSLSDAAAVLVGEIPPRFSRRLDLAGESSPFRVEPLVLASASPRRRDLLESLGIPFVVDAADIDETADVPKDPTRCVETLAERKARAVAARRERGLILAADTIVVQGDVIYNKPDDDEHAFRMLRALAGRDHFVYTGVCVMDAGSGVARTTTVVTRVRFHDATDDELRGYIATGEPFGKAGAYAIQGHGSLLVAAIDGDYTNVVGLPIGATLDLLATFFEPASAAARGGGAIASSARPREGK